MGESLVSGAEVIKRQRAYFAHRVASHDPPTSFDIYREAGDTELVTAATVRDYW